MIDQKPKTFKEFWPIYMRDHQHPTNRSFHFKGTSLAIVLILFFTVEQRLYYLLLAPIAGYSFAWAGHYLIEKNRPATFRYPIWSLMGDFKMFWLMLTRKL